jgi:hypothetical protein
MKGAASQHRLGLGIETEIWGAGFSSSTKRIERVAAEYNHMLYLVQKGKGLRFVEGLSSASLAY